ncbi:MAG: hypothetical protein BIFFINMI_00102 [Phycisphaerae bacterium]|nr:hypothetical protein [Phycisphaerae bacterium]
MLTSRQVEQFQRDGCLVAGRVLDWARLEELRGELQRVLDTGPDGFVPGQPRPVRFLDMGKGPSSPVWQIVNIWEASEPFRKLLHHPQVIEAISQLTGCSDLQIWHDQIQFKPPRTGGVNNWHQDAPYWPVIKPMTPVSAWIALDDADTDNGCMWMVPGSHLWGDRIEYLHRFKAEAFFDVGRDFIPPPEAPTQAVKAIPWPVRAGEVSFHHSLTWHGSYRNTSPRPRRAIALHYMTGDARFNAAGEHLMKQFVHLPDGAPMADAGPHFPVVCRNGRAVAPADAPDLQ